jgi:hypothetical protein
MPDQATRRVGLEDTTVGSVAQTLISWCYRGYGMPSKVALHTLPHRRLSISLHSP